MEDNINELEESIRYYAEQYYLGNPLISDEQFDKLVDKLKILNPQSKVLTTGWGFEVSGNKIKHKYSHIGSLDKTKTYEDIPERFKGRSIFISPKLDGLSAVLYYEKGYLVKALTRGNGEFGKDITDKLMKIVGSEINDKTFTGAVRGELIIRKDNWEKLCKIHTDENMIAPRNYVAGIINRKEVDEEISYIDLVVYKVVGQEYGYQFIFRAVMLDWLHNNFKNAIPRFVLTELTRESWNTQHENVFNTFLELGYGLDGLVLSSDSIHYDNLTNGYLYDEVAFKFAAESSETIIEDIEWTLSRTQRLVPVAIVKPIELSGAVVQRATCNNAKRVKDLGLGSNALVEICRSNEVIPLILDVIDTSDYELPKYCPICESELVWEGVDLKCNNPECANIKLSDLQQWCENIGQTDGLQWTLMKQYLDLDNIHSIEELYANKDLILQKYNYSDISITTQKMYSCYKKMFLDDIDIKVALTALNIPRLGDKTAEALGQNKTLVEKLLRFSINNQENNDNLKSSLVECVKSATTDSIWANLNKFSNLKYLYNSSEDRYRLNYNLTTKGDIINIAVTGSLETMKRKDFEEYIKRYGYELSSNIKKCKYLINNDITSTSSKNKLAKENNIPIITEKQFLEILK